MNESTSDYNTDIGGNADGSTIVVGDGNIINPLASRPPRPGYICQALALPTYYVPRPAVIAETKRRLLQDTAPGTLVVSAIYGLGGIGKSVLAAAIAYEEDIREHFSDGILWATLGQEPKLLSLLGQWIQTLGDYDFKPTSEEAASSYLRVLLQDKRMLLVVDDVWDSDHAELFRVGRTGCSVLVTTREAVIPGAEHFDLTVMTSDQALALLQQAMRRSLTTDEESQAKKLAKALGYLPLALELAAAQLEDGTSWDELLEDLSAELVRLENFDAPGTQFAGSAASKKRNQSLIASYNLSLNRLAPEQLMQFTWLGVLPEDVAITEKMAATLWQLPARQARSVLSYLKRRALLLAGTTQRDGKLSYRLHDIVRYLTQRLILSPIEPQEAGTLKGLGLATLAQAHRHLLEAYREKTQNRLWHTLPDDGYIHSQLTWHLEQAKLTDEIHQLLQERTADGKNGWFSACGALGQPTIFVTDLFTAWRIADEDNNQSANTLVLQWRYALIRATLNNLAGNIPPELLAVLVEKRLWTPAQGLAYTQQIQELRQRANALAKLMPLMPSEFHTEVLKIIEQISSESWRAYALSRLAPHLPELVPQSLKLTENIQDEFWRAYALSDLAPHLPDELFPQALKLTENIQDEFNRAYALSGLAPHLPDELFPRALKLTENIKNEAGRANALNGLAPHLPDELFPQAWKLTKNIQDESWQAYVLISLAPHLPDELVPQALKLTENIQDKSWRAYVLSGLAPHLPDLVAQALTLAENIQDKSWQANVLNGLAPHLPDELFPQALKLTENIQHESKRAYALSGLAPHLPDELFPRALKFTENIPDESGRAIALRSLAPHLPEKLVPQALKLTENIQDEYSQVYALSGLAPHLPELVPQALKLIENIQDEYSQVYALSGLAPHLPELVPQALKLIENIQDEYSQANALSGLSPHLPDELFPQALKLAENIQDEYSRANALGGLSPHLPDLVEQALKLIENIQNEYSRANMLSGLAPHLPDALVPQALKLAENIQDESWRVNALSSLAPHLPKLVPQALKLTENIQNESKRAYALSGLALHLLDDLFPQALKLTENIQDESSRAIALGSLAPHLPDELFPQAWKLTKNIQDGYERAGALREFLPRLNLDAMTFSEWCNILQELTYRRRQDLLSNLPRLAPAILNLGNEETLRQVVATIEEVCEQWP